MLYCKSKYTRCVSVNENVWYVYNLISGAECMLDAPEKSILDNVNIKGDKDINLIENWYEMGLIVDQDIDEDACLELERRINMYSFASNQVGAVIAPTMDCNAKCFYCYENDTRATCYMDEKTASDVVEYIKKMAKDKKVFLFRGLEENLFYA